MQGGHVLGDLKVILRSSSVRKHSPHLPTWETRVNGRIAGGAKVCEPQAGRHPKGSRARGHWEVRAPSGCYVGNGLTEEPTDGTSEKPPWLGLQLLRGPCLETDVLTTLVEEQSGRRHTDQRPLAHISTCLRKSAGFGGPSSRPPMLCGTPAPPWVPPSWMLPWATEHLMLF